MKVEGFKKPIISEQLEAKLSEIAKSLGFDVVVCAPCSEAECVPFLVLSESVLTLVSALERIYGVDTITVIRLHKEE